MKRYTPSAIEAQRERVIEFALNRVRAAKLGIVIDEDGLLTTLSKEMAAVRAKELGDSIDHGAELLLVMLSSAGPEDSEIRSDTTGNNQVFRVGILPGGWLTVRAPVLNTAAVSKALRGIADFLDKAREAEAEERDRIAAEHRAKDAEGAA